MYKDPRISKICELGNVIISAQYLFQSLMPQVPDGSDGEVCVFLSLCSHHLLNTQDIDKDAGSSEDELKSNTGSVNNFDDEES